MNEIVNNNLLEEDKFMSKMHLRERIFTYWTSGPFTKNKERIKKLKKHEISDIKTNYMKFVFNMTWLMVILKILVEEQLLMKYCMTKELI